MSTRATTCLLACLLACLLLAACGGGGGGPAPEPPSGIPPTRPTGSLSGRIELLSGVPGVVFEQEPNDDFDQAAFVAQLPVGGRLTIFGDVDATAGDLRDGFRLRVRPRLRLHAVLEMQHPETNDVILQVYDPVAMQVVETYSAADAAAGATIHASGDVDLVLQANAGAGNYELALAADAPFDPLREREPNGDPTTATYLGQTDLGETITLEGTADGATDAHDGVLLLVPAAARLQCRLEHPAFTTFAAAIEDVTADLDGPLPLARFGGVPGGPQTGSVAVAGGTLVHVAVEAAAGGGPWRLQLDVLPPATGLVLPTAVAPAAPAARRAYMRTTPDIVAGEAVVRFRRPVEDSGGLARFGARLSASGRGAVRRVSLDLPASTTTQARRRATWSRIRALAGRTDVAWVEPNYRVYAATEPSDTYYDLQWHYDLIDLPRAWDITTGDASVIVAVVDTGQTNHPDLVGRQIPGYDLISSASRAGDGDGIDGDPTDTGDGGSSGRHSWHGTHVAGTIGASSDNDEGVAGVTWATRIMHVRALGIGGGTTFDVANAVLYAAGLANSSDHVPDARADVINLSLGGLGYSQTLADACQAATDEGVLVVAAAGNSSSSVPHYPAAYPGVVSVMAVGAGSDRAPYSNYGTTVDLAAPGGDLSSDRNADGYADGVLSTLWDGSGNAAYAFYQGTSMACPHVVGLAALLLAEDPSLGPAGLETLLTATATDLGLPGRDDVYGHGLINAYQALLEVGDPPPPGPPELHVNPLVLNFGQDKTEMEVRIRNYGSSFLDVEGIESTTQDGGTWLRATAFGPTEAASAERVLVRVDRSGLLTGTYRGEIQIASNGGTALVEVVMGVATNVTPPPNLDVFVVAVDAQTGAEVARTSVNPAGSLVFTFPSLPVGRYLLRAGTDVDGDGVLGEDGDYVGEYPLAGQAVVLEVIEGSDRGNNDFDVTFTPTLDAGRR